MPAISSYALQYSNVVFSEIADSSFDLFITEGRPFDSTPAISDAQVSALQDQGRLVFGYVNAAVTDDSRWYWNAAWTSNGADTGTPDGDAPAWLQQGTPVDFDGSPGQDALIVDFSDPAWRQMVIDQAVELVSRGYSGIFLDDVASYDLTYTDADRTDPAILAIIGENAIAMATLVAEVAAAIGPDAQLFVNVDPYMTNYIPNTAEGNAAKAAYFAAVDGWLFENPTVQYLDDGRINLPQDSPFLILRSRPGISDADAQARGILYVAPDGDYDALGYAPPSATAGDDTIVGGDGPNAIDGLGGNDRIDGGAGDDQLDGGPGNDFLIAGYGNDRLDGGDGDDLLAGATNLSGAALHGGAYVVDTDGTEGDGYAVIGGDVMSGGAGNDRLVAGYGSSLDGGSGTDTAVLSLLFAWEPWVANTILTWYNYLGVDTDLAAAAGSTVTIPIGGCYPGLDISLTGIERFDITFGSGGDRVFGGALNDRLRGDSYNFPGGDDELHGAGGDDELDGSGGSDRLYGDEGNDSLDGGVRSPGYDDYLRDELYGGGGDDRLVVRLGDYADGGAGTDLLILDLRDTDFSYNIDVARMLVPGATYHLGDGTAIRGVELFGELHFGRGNDTVRGTEAADHIHGDRGNDNLIGRGGDDTLIGDGGNDILNGGAGNDDLDGGGGNDRLDGGAGADEMTGWTGDDRFYVDHAGDEPWEWGGHGNDTVVTTISYTLPAGSEIENFITANAASTAGLTLTGNGHANAITGNAGANALYGLGGNDRLDGGLGADRLSGGDGDDTYFVDNAGDRVVEASAAGGYDTVYSSVSFTLAYQQIERLFLTGGAAASATGNSLANILVGNSAGNLLDGGGGVDVMNGGGGNDTYIVDSAGESVIEAAGGGYDTVMSAVTFYISNAYEIEVLTLTGTASINAYGNNRDNRLNGNSGNNILNGGAGADTMVGGDGNDAYYVDNVGDRVIESSAAGGTDTVYASIGFSLAYQQLENLVLTGAGDVDASGNSLANRIAGNAGANRIYGKGGNDVLSGGGGMDGFYFDTALNALGNVDRILDFSVADDTIFLARTVFAAIGADGTLSASAFRAGTAAQDADDRIVYDAASGNIWYDADGTGSGAQILFATVAAGTALGAADFVAYMPA